MNNYTSTRCTNTPDGIPHLIQYKLHIQVFTIRANVSRTGREDFADHVNRSERTPLD